MNMDPKSSQPSADVEALLSQASGNPAEVFSPRICRKKMRLRVQVRAAIHDMNRRKK